MVFRELWLITKTWHSSTENYNNLLKHVPFNTYNFGMDYWKRKSKNCVPKWSRLANWEVNPKE
jgi:hypothetical protein